ncbi:MAG: hypothetical protein R6W66_00840 [Pelovirga sp.]
MEILRLPRGKLVRPQVNPARVNLPEAMAKLRGSRFTGYLRFDAPQGVGILLFQSGRLISTLFFPSDDKPRQIAYDAIARVFEVSILGAAQLYIYQLSADLVVGIHALLHGRYLLKGEDLQRLDIPALLKRIAQERLNACLRVYAAERTVLIFYDSGSALGFYHEGATELQVTADVGESVAAVAGARLDLVEIQGAEELVFADLMGCADLGPIWQNARALLLDERARREESLMRDQPARHDR